MGGGQYWTKIVPAVTWDGKNIAWVEKNTREEKSADLQFRRNLWTKPIISWVPSIGAWNYKLSYKKEKLFLEWNADSDCFSHKAKTLVRLDIEKNQIVSKEVLIEKYHPKNWKNK